MFCHPRPAGTNIFCSISTKNIPDWSGVEVRRSWRIEKSLEDGIFLVELGAQNSFSTREKGFDGESNLAPPR
jgi:hypothetical protein